MRKLTSHLLICTFLFSCTPTIEGVEVITINEKELIPEGITIGDAGEIYLSNIYAKNITRTQPNSSEAEVIQTEYTGIFSGVGITQRNGKVYALGNTFTQSLLQIIDIESADLLNSYLVEDSVTTFFNDLAVSAAGDIYFTDSNLSKINTIQEDSATLYLTSDEIQYPNGIALSDDDEKLFIASFTKGIRIYDLNTKEFVNEADTTGLTKGIDGLKYYKNSLIGIQNALRNRDLHRIVRFYLDKAQTKVIDADTLFMNHPTFNVPTTFDIKDGWVYCLSNSQLDNLDQEKMELINRDSLTDTFILKFKLEE